MHFTTIFTNMWQMISVMCPHNPIGKDRWSFSFKRVREKWYKAALKCHTSKRGNPHCLTLIHSQWHIDSRADKA